MNQMWRFWIDFRIFIETLEEEDFEGLQVEDDWNWFVDWLCFEFLKLNLMKSLTLRWEVEFYFILFLFHWRLNFEVDKWEVGNTKFHFIHCKIDNIQKTSWFQGWRWWEDVKKVHKKALEVNRNKRKIISVLKNFGRGYPEFLIFFMKTKFYFLKS